MPHKLLLADDSVTIQRVIELTFADEDVQVIAVGNGQDAIDRVQRDPPDIVLADSGMPERNGYEVAAFIKGQPAYAHIPVVLLTGAFEPVDEGRAKSVGCDGVLVKPFEPQIVISRVKELLAGHRPKGMWGNAPVAQGPLRQAPAAAPQGSGGASQGSGAAPQASSPAHSGDSLEAYFDQLDAAFSGATASEAAPAAPAAGQRREPIPIARRAESGAAARRDPLADWDPDLHGDPARPAVAEPPLAFPQRTNVADARPASPAPVAVPPAQAPPMEVLQPRPAATPPPAPQPPAPLMPASLVDAFAALLAAEQRIGLAPSAATVPVPVSSSTQPAAPAPAPVAPSQPTEELVEEVSRRVLARLSEQTRPTILDVAERLVREEIDRIKQSGNL
jgi:CheY-like chemotaxis protein